MALVCQAQWHTLGILALEKPKQGIGEFMANLGYIATVISSKQREGGRLTGPRRDSFRTGVVVVSWLIRSASSEVQPLLKLSVVRAAEHTEVCLCNLSGSRSDTVLGFVVDCILFLQNSYVEAPLSNVVVLELIWLGETRRVSPVRVGLVP